MALDIDASQKIKEASLLTLASPQPRAGAVALDSNNTWKVKKPEVSANATRLLERILLRLTFDSISLAVDRPCKPAPEKFRRIYMKNRNDRSSCLYSNAFEALRNVGSMLLADLVCQLSLQDLKLSMDAVFIIDQDLVTSAVGTLSLQTSSAYRSGMLLNWNDAELAVYFVYIFGEIVKSGGPP
ncbi:hypothetical protein P692DRAFT_20880462 [Suillus brevipes Sb2]|nr:hypothetical protein P692DRAFT_20880462 [Suillus brevipes Sb2]